MINKQLPIDLVPIKFGRLWLTYRWTRYLLGSMLNLNVKGMMNSIRGIGILVMLSVLELKRGSKPRICNLCGWKGNKFYPNLGSGYFDLNVTCPRCHSTNRYRSLVCILEDQTEIFQNDKNVIEVSPIRGFEAYCLFRKNRINYISFDIERHAMEKGDITKMQFNDSSCDYFICFHVLEHVLRDDVAIEEIYRVLKPGGKAVLQVPIDYLIKETVEYGKPNIYETGHVRRYSEEGFMGIIKKKGFEINKINVDKIFMDNEIIKYGLSCEPIFFAAKPK